MQDLSASRWVAAHQSVMITGPTGVGKSYLACALAHKACRDGFTVAYRRVSRLYDELAQARADGTYLTALRRLAKAQLLVLDDFGLEPLGAAERKRPARNPRGSLQRHLDPRHQPARSDGLARRHRRRDRRPTRSATGSSTTPTGSSSAASPSGRPRRP